MNEKLCLECEKPVFGRADKKFCSDACRNAYNNRTHSSVTKYMRQVNNTLTKNRRILLEMNPDGKRKTHKDQLFKRGFDFDFHTGSYTTKSGETYRFCYEQGYLFLALVGVVTNNRNYLKNEMEGLIEEVQQFHSLG